MSFLETTSTSSLTTTPDFLNKDLLFFAYLIQFPYFLVSKLFKEDNGIQAYSWKIKTQRKLQQNIMRGS